MGDVSKVRGERSPDEPTGPKKRKKPDKDFREMMKVGKVRETDPEEKRKRKKQAEAEEEMKAEQTGSVPRQGMEPEPKEPAIFAPESGEGPVGGPEGPQGPSAPPPYMPPEQEPEEPLQYPQQRRPERKRKRPPAAPEHKKKVEKTEKKKKVAGPVPEMKKPKTGATAPHKKEPTLEETEALFKKEGKPAEMESEKKKKKEPEEALPVALPPGAWEATKAPEKEEKKGVSEPETLPTTTPTPTAAPPPGTPAPPPLVAPFAHLSPQVQQVFERMVGVMTVMTDSGTTQTTINLDNPRFAESVFFGAQIIVSEFSTAPKAFNIELLGNQQAMNLMTANAEELVAAFQAGNYNFKVNRIDVGSLPMTREAKRKEVSRVKRKKTGGG